VSSNNEVWAVLDDWEYRPVMVTRETAQLVWYLDCPHGERKTLKALPWRGGKEQAQALAHKLKSARAEKGRRQTDACIWFYQRVKELTETSGE
jgi:hypothetical protein